MANEKPGDKPNEKLSEKPSEKKAQGPLGRGLDVGTANLVGAEMSAEGVIKLTPMRNAFIDIPEDQFTKKMLQQQRIPFIKRGAHLFVVGNDAFELANVFNREMRRPMQQGMIKPSDTDAMPMEVEMIKQVLGEPRVKGEVCYFSIPADPIDSTMNILYHKNIYGGILEKLGYAPRSLNEGHAVIFSELGDDDFTGIGISFGGGMVNVCVAFRSVPVVSFATSKGGDWIDIEAAKVMGAATSARLTAIKEGGTNINKPGTPEQEAISIYTRYLINYTLTRIIEKFSTVTNVPNFPGDVKIAVSGGTTLVGGFEEVFKSEFQKVANDFPIKIAGVKIAEDPLNSTAKGCLLAALAEGGGNS